MVPKSGGGLEEDTAKKKTEESKVNYLVRYQSQEYQKALIFIQTLWNIVYGQCTELFQLALKRKSTWEDCQKDKDLLETTQTHQFGL